ncbi:alcohol dehydrogenase [Chryseobacterium sp. T16E-39]|uniref:quinone oxidoreductase family protein n=1 Tax=Chryseobacterium sp. T16E-39 TaxID=2015076 RepID=UPI000B5B4758|nr:NADP-dependent oxidoreductase [Chryseobacterium sp. T16E-39]ASK32098.1 alcohol dehydrogenase [Chryseobacterium sp. T16E-39]
MKTVILNKNFQLEDGIIEKPQPKNNEVLIQIKASGFNPIDYQMIENELERRLVSSPVLGRELSGVIVGKGEDASQFNIGDEVTCGSGSMGSNGSYAEFITVPEAIVVLKPKNISFEQAAAIPSVGMTALQTFDRIPLKPGDSILITGATGGVGSFLIKLLLADHFNNIVATVGSEENRTLLLEMGLKKDQIINYKEDHLKEKLIKANGNQYFDFGVDLVGNYMSEITAEVLKVHGMYVDVTALISKDAKEILFNKGNIIMNISNYTHSMTKNYDYYKSSLTRISNLIEEKIIVPPKYKVLGTLSLETVLTAHQMLKNNLTQGNKLIMTH